ncbi:chorismate mutase [Roseivirga sp. E12]|uniref:chorismate mutase n=1 Tax=Roseivirga sp. E12 TaxID=2819237 RepID=UPI001ABCC5A3|nr:chorismate mutase [Roseivirga sp. E12]MBO3700047.1 bifunctional 3-deoxy-7-phosphoheptulonate synthase/chorismate mutase type II [Roseivirga sp. E12]
MQITAPKDWIEEYKKPLVLAGPCSVESEKQFRASVLPIVDNVDIIRGGIWKPRTRPGSFEGVGEKGLQWVKSLKEEVSFKFATEVATPEHVELALKYHVDVLWIGARTTVNPFNVSELASSLKGVDIPVFVKNPIHPELSLWKGALERFSKAGITKLGAIHRGFHTYEKKKYRNAPFWQIPLELKSEFPTLPLICDPSHIGGSSDSVEPLAQRALDLDYDGVMIEAHCDPSAALSDAKQQVSTASLLEIISRLSPRDASFTKKSYLDQLEIIREQIDQADRELLEAIAVRMSLVEKIGEFKKENNVAIFQISRWKEIFKSRPDWGKQLNLDDDFIVDLLRLLHQQSVKKQTEVFNTIEEEQNYSND